MKLRLFLCVYSLIDIGNAYITRPIETSPVIKYRTKATNDIIIPVMVHLDKALTHKLSKYYGVKSRKKLKSITTAVLENARKLLTHPSLNQTVKLKLIDSKFLRYNRMLKADSDASKYLKSYCDWQSRRKIAKKNTYYSILLTGLDLFYVVKGVKNYKATGRSYKDGVCNVRKNCALLEWEPRNIAYLIAHEIGHSLGLNHDGLPFNQCKDKTYVMASKYNEQNHPKSWSSCSREYLKLFLRSRKAWCLKTDRQITFEYN